jgi:hypothetical protein
MDWGKLITEAIQFLNSPAGQTTISAIEKLAGLITKLADTHPVLVTDLGNVVIKKLNG